MSSFARGRRRPNRRGKSLSLFAALMALCGVTFFARAASATPNFPAYVQSFYHWPSIVIDPPMGCTLCHKDDNGGLQSTLSPFGRLLNMQFGVMAYDDNPTVNAALTALAMSDPLLAMDLQQQMDPNGDVGKDMSMLPDGGMTGVAAAGPADPVPTYGCSVSPGASTRRDAPWLVGEASAFIVFTGALARRRRSRKRSILEGSSVAHPPREEV